MADFLDCKFEENFIARLEQGINEISTSDFELFENKENTIVLNFNTNILNKELRAFRKIQNGITKSKPISSSIKRKFREKFIPQQIYKEFDQARIDTVQDLNNFVISTQKIVPFRKTFQNENKILKSLQELDPNTYRDFSSDFPATDLRLESGPISTAEVDALIRENGFDQRTFATAVERNGRNIFNLLERLLSGIGIGLGIMGTFCSLLDDVYALSRNQRDISSTSSDFLQNFQNILGLINPSAGDAIGRLQELIQLLQEVQETTNNIANDIGSAIGLIGSIFGMAINFADILDNFRNNTDQKSSIQGEWNFEEIRDAITVSDSRFLITPDGSTRFLGDINNDGIVNSSDASDMQDFIDETAPEEVVGYINDVLLTYMNKNISLFVDFLDIPSASKPNNSNIGNMANTLSSVTNKFGVGMGSGDFGIGKLFEAVGIAQGLISSIQGLTNASKPVNIQGLFQQLEQIQQLAASSRSEMFSDFNDFSTDYNDIVKDALREAEEQSTQSPSSTTSETSKNFLKSLKDEYTPALENIPVSSKTLGAKMDRVINLIRESIRKLASVGVLEKTAEQLDVVIDQSARQLRSKIGNYSVTTLNNNGYNWNMESSYRKFAGHKAIAFNAASDVTAQKMKDSVRGKIAKSTEKFQEKSKEEVEYVAFRFCKIAGEIERLYNEATEPMQTMIEQFQSSSRAMTFSGNAVTQRAIQAGAIRYDEGTMAELARRQALIEPTITDGYIDSDTGLISTVPTAGTLPTGVLPPSSREYNFPSYQQAEQGAGGVRYVGSQVPNGFTVRSNKSGPGVDPTAMKNLYKLAAIWPEEIIVTSAYRDPVHNANVGGSPSSKHISGEAFDIRMPTSVDIQKRVDFCNAAYRSGFTGILIYGSHIHIAMSNEQGVMKGGDFNYFALPGQLGYKTVG